MRISCKYLPKSLPSSMERAKFEVISWGNLTSKLWDDMKLEAASTVASNSFTVFSSRFSPTMSDSLRDLAFLATGAVGSLKDKIPVSHQVADIILGLKYYRTKLTPGNNSRFWERAARFRALTPLRAKQVTLSLLSAQLAIILVVTSRKPSPELILLSITLGAAALRATKDNNTNTFIVVNLFWFLLNYSNH